MIKHFPINGSVIEGEEFFQLLYTDNEFIVQLGQVTLLLAKLESELIRYIKRENIIVKNLEKKTLGGLLELCKVENLLGNNFIIALHMIKDQRNYLIHNLHYLLIEKDDNSRLPTNDLLPADILTYREALFTMIENVEHLTAIISEL